MCNSLLSQCVAKCEYAKKWECSVTNKICLKLHDLNFHDIAQI